MGNTTLAKGELVTQSEYFKIDIGSYKVMLGEANLGEISIKQGGVYHVLLAKNPETSILGVSQYTLTVPNSIHILWLIPQYFVITVGEIMFSITGLEFSMFAILMILDMFLFAWLAWRYVPGEAREDDIKMEPTGIVNGKFKSDE